MLTWFLQIRTHHMANGTDVSFAIPRATDVCFITNTLKVHEISEDTKKDFTFKQNGNPLAIILMSFLLQYSQGSLNSHPVC